MTVHLYHGDHTRSLRVLWLLEEMGIPYGMTKIQLAFGNTGGEDYAKVNPLQKLPAIEVDGQVMVESTAILEFMANRFGGQELLIPVDHDDYGQFLQWLHGGEGGFGMYLSLFFGHTLLLPKEQRNAAIAEWAAGHLQKTFSLFGDNLGRRSFIAGDKFTIADISVGYVAYGMSLLGKLEEFAPENVNAWWAQMSARPALQKAISL
jgi:glutathione S-transferase